MTRGARFACDAGSRVPRVFLFLDCWFGGEDILTSFVAPVGVIYFSSKPLLYGVTVRVSTTLFFGRIFVSGFSEKKVLAENLNKQITVCFCHCGHFFLHLSSWAGGLGLERLLFNLYLGSTMKNTESHRESEINRLTKPSRGKKTSHRFSKEKTTKLPRFTQPMITSFI